MALPEPPCRDCQHRRLGCHDPAACRPWGVYLTAKEAADQARRARLAEDGIMAGYDKARRQYRRKERA